MKRKSSEMSIQMPIIKDKNKNRGINPRKSEEALVEGTIMLNSRIC
jgi:hypothetical protein